MAVVGGMFAADRPIYDLVQRNSSSGGRDIADKFSDWGGPGALLGLNAGVIAVGVASESYGASSKLKDAGLVSLEAEGFASAATAALKMITGRERPEASQGTTQFRPFSGLDTSLASTHAAASFAVATVFAERYEGAGWITYPLAVFISGSRVYLDKHFSADVVAGALIGYGLGHFLNARHSGDPTDWQIRPLALARIIHERFCCNRGFAAATRLRWQARHSPPRRTVQVRLGISRLRMPVSQRDCAISRRIVTNNAG